MNDKLPPLPEPDFTRVIRQPYPFGDDFIPYYSAAQMEEYARLAAPVQVAPAGWKLVPVEPTPEMRAAISRQMGFQEREWSFNPSAVYRDALAAAPAAPMQPGAAADDARDAARLEFVLRGIWETQEMLIDILHDVEGFPVSKADALAAIDAAMSASTPAAKPADPAEEQGS